MDLSTNIKYPANLELQKIMHKTFVDILLAESGKEGDNLNRLTSKAVLPVVLAEKVSAVLFSNWKMPEIGCFIHMGGCQNENEALFLRF